MSGEETGAGDPSAVAELAAQDAAVRHLLAEGTTATDGLPVEGGTPALDLVPPFAVVALWHPLAATPRDGWQAARTAATMLTPAVHPVPERLGAVQRDVAVLVVPGCDDPLVLRADLLRACGGSSLVAVYDLAGAPSEVPDAYSFVQEVFDAASLARRVLGAVMSVDELLPFHAVSGLSSKGLFRTVRTWLGPILSEPPTSAEKLLETARLVFTAARWKVNALAPRLGLTVGATRNRLQGLGDALGVALIGAGGYVEIPFDLRLALHLYDLFAEVLPLPGDPRWRQPQAVGS